MALPRTMKRAAKHRQAAQGGQGGDDAAGVDFLDRGKAAGLKSVCTREKKKRNPLSLINLDQNIRL